MNIEEIKLKFNQLKEFLRIDEKKSRLLILKKEISASDLWQNQSKAIELTSEIAEADRLINQVESLELIISEKNSSSADLAEAGEIINLLETQKILSNPHDIDGAILSIHSGTGGVDAMDWAQLLERMYLRFLENGQNNVNANIGNNIFGVDRSGWQAKIVDRQMGEEAGIKSSTILIYGRYAFGLLKRESGVHRLVRLSPFNAKNLRQTSFALVDILPFSQNNSSLADLVIPDKDLRIDTFRSSGAGGQHVNVTDSAVRITHIPTGVIVSVQNERSQHQNKEVAMSILKSKLQNLLEVEKKEKLNELRGEHKQAVWGNQIRSYVLQPYKLVKDHRTNVETSDVEGVLNGNINTFIESELRLLSDI